MTGAELQNWRRELGYTQAEIAHALGTTARTWQRWESARTAPLMAGYAMLGYHEARKVESNAVPHR